MERKKFEALLRQHDWYYEFSDSYSDYCRGRDNLIRIKTIVDSDEEMKKVYDDYVKKLNEGAE